MPKSKFQEFIFTVLMASVMVYGMVCYNISLNEGNFSNTTLIKAFHELPIMIPVACILELAFVGALAKIVTFKKLVDPSKTQPFFITCCISACSVWMMCPLMSLAATFLFKGGETGQLLAILNGGFQGEILSTWIKTTILNYPMAFFWQFFIAGPLVRLIFGLIFRSCKQ